MKFFTIRQSDVEHLGKGSSYSGLVVSGDDDKCLPDPQFCLYLQEILVNINAQVAEKEREQRLLEIYHKIDAKSSAIYMDQKFKKSDLFSRSRKLK